MRNTTKIESPKLGLFFYTTFANTDTLTQQKALERCLN
ncbi:MAG: hypothetical protein RL609_830 [Bacteroidota bacterium]|jgi:hypothetical protein